MYELAFLIEKLPWIFSDFSDMFYDPKQLMFLVTMKIYYGSKTIRGLHLKFWKNSGRLKILEEVFMNFFRFFGIDLLFLKNKSEKYWIP